MIRSLALAAALATTAAADVRELQFVACPVYRDTDNGRKSGCWLASDPQGGTRYDVTAGPTKPDWNRAILVEGRIAEQAADVCGGTVLDPVRVSVLDTPCPRFSIPAEGYKGRRFELPARNVRPLHETRATPDKPYVERRFTIPFDFGSGFIVYQLSDYYLDQMIGYAIDVRASRIIVSGSAQQRSRAISGMDMAEPALLARERAEIVRQALIQRGVASDRIAFGQATPEPYVAQAFDGLDGPTARRVDVRVIP